MAADSSLFRCEEKNRTYTLLENDVFIVGRKESRLLSSGQYLDIPGGATVTVELEATVELIEEYRGRGIPSGKRDINDGACGGRKIYSSSPCRGS